MKNILAFCVFSFILFSCASPEYSRSDLIEIKECQDKVEIDYPTESLDPNRDCLWMCCQKLRSERKECEERCHILD